MKLLLISDTHEKHRSLSYLNGFTTDEMQQQLKEVDVLIHAGDITRRGDILQLKDFAEWLSEIPIEHKIVVPGNHDLCFQDYDRRHAFELMETVPGMNLLMDNGCEINGVKFFGVPWTPTFGKGWAFNVDESRAKLVWNNVSSDTDVVVCHGPPYGYSDRMPDGRFTGSKVMLERMKEIKPKLIVCGHIHEARGTTIWNGLTVVNASNILYQRKVTIIRDPIFFDLEI